MFDRFTENSKKLMSLAQQAAQQKRHDAIEPEHILTGMLMLPASNAVTILKQLGIDTDTLLEGLQNLFPPGEAAPGSKLPFAPASKRVLELTIAEAARLQHNYIGSQHMLVALIREGQSAAADVLTRAGVDPEAIAEAVVAGHEERTRRRLLLISNSTMHGGGYLEHCAHEIKDFLGGRRRVLFVPYALHDHDAYAEKARATFAGLGYELTSIHEHKHRPAALDDADAVFIGGGNTFRLLSALCHYELLSAIRDRALAGLSYIGSSAGTNVATLSIRTTNDMPIVQPPSFTALQLVPFQINPHYLDPEPQSRHMGETREERILQFHEEHSTPVLGLREGCMLRVHGDRMELRGTTKARLFRRNQSPEEFAPPCDLSFLLED